MKKKIAVFTAVLILCVGSFGAGRIFGAGSSEPGSQGDPVVTLSYLNARLAEAGGGTGTSGNIEAESPGAFKQVKLEAGETLMLSDGSELVVYSGNSSVLGNAGLIDLTDGSLFKEGTSTVLYHVYLAVGGNSGIKASGKMIIYVRIGAGA